MKYKTTTRSRTVQHGPAGQERPLVETYQVRVPQVPADWDARAVKAATTLVLGLTGIAVVWSTVSIGALLHGGVGYAAAALFDLAWIVNVLLEWLSRYDKRKRGFSRRLGWGLLGCTMGAILWHGLILHSVPLAVVGAAVSMFAKTLWMGIMRFIDRDLSDLDQQWVDREISQANAKLAISSVRRQVARAESRATLELLAAEQTRREFSGLLADEAGLILPAAPAESFALVDAMTSGRHDAISPAGDSADVRPETAPEPVNRPLLAPLFQQAPAGGTTETDAPADAPAPLPTAPTGPRVTLARAVRELVAGGVTDPKAISSALPALLGEQPNPGSVGREIRAAKRAATRDARPEPSPYL
jgi:hypothetical protein